jgi:uncharacterized protein (UPF0332 family)
VSVAFDFEDFLDVADGLMRINKWSEGYCRSAVSRAFYAVWHEAKDYLNTNKGLQKVYKRDGVVAEFQKHRDAKVRALGGLLEDLNTRRNEADYKLSGQLVGPIFTPEQTELDVKKARDLIDDIKQVRMRLPQF